MSSFVNSLKSDNEDLANVPQCVMDMEKILSKFPSVVKLGNGSQSLVADNFPDLDGKVREKVPIDCKSLTANKVKKE